MSAPQTMWSSLINVTPVCDTSAYGAGDTLFDRTLVANAVPENDACAILQSIAVLDEDFQAAAVMTFFFLDADVAFGTLNAAPSMTDANARNIMGSVAMPSANFLSLTGSRQAYIGNLGFIVKPAVGTRSIWVAATTAGTPTQTASGIKLRLGFRAF